MGRQTLSIATSVVDENRLLFSDEKELRRF